MYQYIISLYGQIVFYCMDIPHFIYTSVNGHLDCFHSLVVMSSAAMYIHVQVFVWACVFISLSLEYVRRRGIGGHIVTLFNFNCRTVSQSSCSILHSHQEYNIFHILTDIISFIIAILMRIMPYLYPQNLAKCLAHSRQSST